MGITEEHGKFRARLYDSGRRINLGSRKSKSKARQAINTYKNQNRKQEDYKPVKENPMPARIRPLKIKFTRKAKNAINKGREWLKEQLDN